MSDDPLKDYNETRRKDLDSESAQRQAELEQAIERQVKDEFLLGIESSKVEYILSPRVLPWAHVDLARLSEAISSKYKATFLPDQKLGAMGPSMQLWTEEAAPLRLQLVSAVRTGVIGLVFVNGLYTIRGSDSVPLSRLEFSAESVSVSVLGSSDVAEVVAKECVELLWETVGEPRTWSSIEPNLQLKKYQTQTRNSFGGEIHKILGVGFQKFLREDLMPEGAFGAKMLPQGPDMSPESLKQVRASANLDDLYIKLNVFNAETGFSEVRRLALNIGRATDYGTGIINCTSELPFEDHLNLIRALLRRLKADTQQHSRGAGAKA